MIRLKNKEFLMVKCLLEGVSLYLDRCWPEFKAGSTSSPSSGSTGRTGLTAPVNLMTCSSSAVAAFFFLNIDKTNLLVYIGCGQSGMVFEQWVLVYCCSFFSNNVALNQAITIYYSSSKPNDQPNLCFLF